VIVSNVFVLKDLFYWHMEKLGNLEGRRQARIVLLFLYRNDGLP
jgi:hypothetical protein